MLTPAPSVWALTALGVSFIVDAVYLLIFFMLLYLIGWPLTKFFRAIATLLNHE